jgi:hypothetical protein
MGFTHVCGKRVQRLMLATPRAKPVREAQKVKEDEHQGDADAFIGQAVGVTVGVSLK